MLLYVEHKSGSTSVLKQDFNTVTCAQMSRTMKQFKSKWAYLLNGKVLQNQHILCIKYELHVQHGFQARTILQNLRMQAIEEFE